MTGLDCGEVFMTDFYDENSTLLVVAVMFAVGAYWFVETRRASMLRRKLLRRLCS